MTIRADITKKITPSRTRRGWYGAEEWQVWDAIPDPTGGASTTILIENTLGYCDPNKFASVADLPQYGTPGPLTNSLYTDLRVIEVVSPWSYIVLATYASFGLYTGGPRALTSISGGSYKREIPVFQLQNLAPGVDWYVRRDFSWQRENTLRTETRFIPGNRIDEIQTAIARSVGGWYRIPNNVNGDFYILSGQTEAQYDGHAYTRVNYKFETWAKFPGAGAGDVVLKNSVAIPALGNLEDWAVSFPNDDPSEPPVITVVPITSFASQGLSLPGFP